MFKPYIIIIIIIIIIVSLDLCQELVFLTINSYRAFTTHPVVCIQTFGPGGIIYYT